MVRTPRKVADEAANEFVTVRGDLRAFIDKHERLFREFFAMVDRYNEAFDDAKAAIGALPDVEKLSVGPFNRAAPPQSTVVDPLALPVAVLRTPGVVTAVDHKVVEQLVLAGALDAGVARKATRVEEGTPRVSGPTKIVINLG